MTTKKNSKLFKPEGEWTRNIHLDWLGDFTPSVMAEAFKVAADATIERCEEDHRHPDRYFYPVAYLYRHSVELELKNIIDLGKQLTPRPSCETNGVGHNLNALWNDAVLVIEVAFPHDDRDLLRRMKALLDELNVADPDGQSFRYYRNTKGKVNLKTLPRVFSLRRFQAEMHEFSLFLQSCATGIDMAVQSQMEMPGE